MSFDDGRVGGLTRAVRAQLGWPFILILAFGLSNALLYACLLPLWDGFDEPFHYGYVTTLSVDHRLPVLHQTRISQEIQQSLRLIPLGSVLSHALPGTTSLDAWLALPDEERLSRRVALTSLPPGARRESSELWNHEAQQAPLAYVLLVPLDWLLSGVSLAPRIVVMRLAICICSTLLLALACLALFQAVGIERRFQNMALFLLFATQMTWAAIAHVSNDWLAIPVATAFLAALATLMKRGGKKPAIWLALFFATGLLTKAYFLAFVPVFLAALLSESILKKIPRATLLLAMAIPLLAAGLWYVRNLLLYGSVSGTQESVAGVGLLRTLEAVPHINWPAATIRLARASLWTGNWSFISSPRWPLNLELILAGIALVILIGGRRKLETPERWVLASCGVFLLAMAYQEAAMWAFTNGSNSQAEPWYLQCVMPAIVSLVALGMQRGALFGRVLAALLTSAAAGVSAGSYLAVLLPWYGGLRDRGSAALIQWWLHADPFGVLATVTIASTPWLCGLLILFVGLLVVASVMACRGIISRPEGIEPDPADLEPKPIPL
jgi:Predicted membrane protein (DUF2142)